MIPGFDDTTAQIGGETVAWSAGGDGPPVLLLHGFPQTRALWAEIGPLLAREYRVIAPDLRGYGASQKPRSHEDATFRHMARDLAGLMESLGHARYHVTGHDRGARTAHRLVLDHPDRVASLQLLDIIPTHLLLTDLRRETALAYYHWFFLAQPSPFPERLIAADPDYVFESCLLGWGAARIEDFAPAQLEAYRAAWRDPATIKGMCDDYRAAALIDVDLDAADLDRRIPCPTHILWGADGAMGRQYDVPATWADRCAQPPHATPMPGGHFFPDTSPEETAAALARFLAEQAGL
jgi:haloacetate dehalogenase